MLLKTDRKGRQGRRCKQLLYDLKNWEDIVSWERKHHITLSLENLVAEQTMLRWPNKHMATLPCAAQPTDSNHLLLQFI